MHHKIAVVGCGYWGKNLVRHFDGLSVLDMVCDTSPEGLSLAHDLAPNTNRVNDYADVLRSDVKGVVIATPAEITMTRFNGDSPPE